MESNTLGLRWRFYHVDGILDGYYGEIQAAFNVEAEYHEGVNIFDGTDYHEEEDYEFEDYGMIFEDDDGLSRGPPPAAKSAVESLPTHIICLDSEVGFCSICIDPIAIDDEAKTLPCNHFYHSKCILKWLGQRNFCPLCQSELPSDVDEDHQQ